MGRIAVGYEEGGLAGLTPAKRHFASRKVLQQFLAGLTEFADPGKQFLTDWLVTGQAIVRTGDLSF